MITKKHLDALAASKFGLLKSKDIFKDNIEGLKKEIASDLNQLAELSLEEVYTERFNYFKLKGTTAEDFRERIIEIEKDKFILAGIRFRGLNVDRPFISIVTSFEITNNRLYNLAEVIKNEFSIFKPNSFQFQLPSEIALTAPELEIDRFTVVGSVKKITDHCLPERSEIVEIVELNNTVFYEGYIKEYKIFHEKNIYLKDEVKPESAEDFNEAIRNKLLYKIMIDNKHAGIIAGSPFNYYGIQGVCILEEILYDSFKGKGLGIYIQKEFSKKLIGRYDLLWGTISSLNQPSLKTALRNGRKIEEIEYSFKV